MYGGVRGRGLAAPSYSIVKIDTHFFELVLNYIYNTFVISPSNINLGGDFGSNLEIFFYALSLTLGVVLLTVESLKGQWGEAGNDNGGTPDVVIFRSVIAIGMTMASVPLMVLIARGMWALIMALNHLIWHSSMPMSADFANFTKLLLTSGFVALAPEIILPILLILMLILTLIVAIQVGMELIKFWVLMILAPIYNITHLSKMSMIKDFWLEVLTICLSQIGQILLLNLIFFLANPLLQIGALVLAITSPSIIKKYTSSNNASVLMTPLTMMAPSFSSKMTNMAQTFGVSGIGSNLMKTFM